MAHESHFADERKSIFSTSMADPERTLPCFDCNICLDFARDPVVTLCGHLYCWPCIYKWFFVQTSSLDSDEHPNCPVCKSQISHTTVVPLYGRGQIKSEIEPEFKGATHEGIMVIPPRPPACGTRALLAASNTDQQIPYHDPYHGIGGTTSSSTSFGSFNSNVGLFGEMVYARVFGNSESLYAYPNSYHLAGSNNPRLRRLEMQAHKSLNRVTIFLTCCLVLCLLLF